MYYSWLAVCNCCSLAVCIVVGWPVYCCGWPSVIVVGWPCVLLLVDRVYCCCLASVLLLVGCV